MKAQESACKYANIIETDFDNLGTYTEPWSKDMPTYNLRKLFEYCKKVSKRPMELSEDERERFRTNA